MNTTAATREAAVSTLSTVTLATSAAILAVQGIAWTLGLLFVTTLQLEVLYPYVTLATLTWFGLLPVLNFVLATWMLLLAIISSRKPRQGPANRLAPVVFAICAWLAMPFGPIVGALYLASSRDGHDEKGSPHVKHDILGVTVAMFCVSALIVAAVLVVVPVVLKPGMIDLAYPYITRPMLPWFTALGGYYIVLVTGDIVLSIAYMAKRVDPLSPVGTGSRLGKMASLWLVLHVLALPVGPFLAMLCSRETRRRMTC
jgi:hypothetical protein